MYVTPVFFDYLPFSTCREEYIAKVRNAAKKSKNPYVSVIWSEAGAQPALEEAAGLTFGFPALVALSVEKKVLYPRGRDCDG